MPIARPVYTWNVLHPIHGINWSEPVMERHPDERARMDAIAGLVASWCAEPGAVVCLQEVSGDQLARLRAAVPPHAAVFAHRAPRIPRLRAPRSGPSLADPGEHVVVVVAPPAAAGARQVKAAPFEDPGKGYLAVDAGDGLSVIATHVSFGDARRRQLETLAKAAHALPGVVVVAGDFNVALTVVRDALGEGAAFADLSREPLHTRPREDGTRLDIDHVLVLGGEVEAARVIDAGDLSDHRPVHATVSARG